MYQFTSYSSTLVSVLALCSTVRAAVLPETSLRSPRYQYEWNKRDAPAVEHKALESRSCNNGPSSRNCWSDGFDIDTNYDEKWPDTGKTVTYNLDITYGEASPDGVSKKMFLINGQYPGPTIEANWGDNIQVTVKNSLPENGTGIHWHGIRQLNTVMMDGASGVTECPIPPGSSKTYSFKATQYGSSWYHSHYAEQYCDGIAGPIVIHGPTTANYDTDLGPVQLTDWFYGNFIAIAHAARTATGPPQADTALVNGAMTSSSGGTYAKFELEKGKKHLIRLINNGANEYFHVALDKHKFQVVAADFVPIKPYTTDSIQIAVGQRYDVIIDADQDVSSYWMRIGIGGGCDGPNTNSNNIRAIFAYKGCNDSNPTSSGSTPGGSCADESFEAYNPEKVPSASPEQLDLGFNAPGTNGSFVQWTIDSTAIAVDWQYPTVKYIKDGNKAIPAANNVKTVSNSGWSYWVIQQAATNPALPHPIHLHGHDFFVLGSGTGIFSDLLSSITLDFSSPIKRDVASVPAAGWLVVAFKTDNPGTWLMHCHIPFHLQGGLGMQFIERQSEINTGLGNLDDQCAAWKKYADSNHPDEDGSGL